MKPTMEPTKQTQSLRAVRGVASAPSPIPGLLAQVETANHHLATATKHAESAQGRLAEVLGTLQVMADYRLNGNRPNGIQGKIAKAIRALGQSIRHSDAAELALEGLVGMIQGGGDADAPGEGGPLALRTGFQRVVLKRIYQVGKKGYFEFLFDGATRTFPRASGELLVELAADRGEGGDEFVGFKSRRELKEALGISSGTLATRFTRLRQQLEKSAISDELIEISPNGKGWRFRVRRGGAADRVAGDM